jgi:asparagine synthetase B (glutamine-hydrolysing)
MCGIFCSISRHGFINPDGATKELLTNRGPDASGRHQVTVDTEDSSRLHATFHSTVLSLRGQSIVEQPLRDAEISSIFCWNGEAWSIGGEVVTDNDSQIVFEKLRSASSGVDSSEASIQAVITLLASIRGPYAFVFYDAPRKLLYYGRDCLGRRSLLRKATIDGSLILSSVCDNANGESWAEVEADGIYLLDICHLSPNQSLLSPRHISHRLGAGLETPALSSVGKSPGLDVSLTSLDSAIPSNESKHRQ